VAFNKAADMALWQARSEQGGKGKRVKPQRISALTKEELTVWALANGWRVIAGHPSLTKPSAPNDPMQTRR
jgi:hypothetical protein